MEGLSSIQNLKTLKRKVYFHQIDTSSRVAVLAQKADKICFAQSQFYRCTGSSRDL